MNNYKDSLDKGTYYIFNDGFNPNESFSKDQFPNGTCLEVCDRATKKIIGYYEAVEGNWYKYSQQQ